MEIGILESDVWIDDCWIREGLYDRPCAVKGEAVVSGKIPLFIKVRII